MANEVAMQGKVINDKRPDSEKICFTQEGNRLVYRYDGEELWIEPWGENSLRVRAAKMAKMPLENWALSEKVKECAPEISIYGDGRAEIRNGKLCARFSAMGKLSFYNQDGKLLLDEYV
ncbi:MAG: hypothetical protein K2P19_10905, partial [Kineothrix sp.]|nr:hypothetical protein [Kineothrix sp.]